MGDDNMNQAQEQQDTRAVEDITPDYAEGVAWLMQHLSPRDLALLSPGFLVHQVQLANISRKAVPWGTAIPDDIFLNYVVPPFVVSEQRQDSRKFLQDLFAPAISQAETATQAAAILNHKVFSQLEVKYSPRPPRTDQAPLETISSGVASCTGLSILLVSAYRAVGIPARFVGVPRWWNDSGNHSWVEIWDPQDQNWHFTGAAEPTDSKLDQAWFTESASKAKLGDRLYGIYAVSFAKTDTLFPMVWASSPTEIYAEEVTTRYISRSRPADQISAAVPVRVLDAHMERVAVPLVLRNGGVAVFSGVTKDDANDTNDHLMLPLKESYEYDVEYRCPKGVATKRVTSSAYEAVITLYTETETSNHPITLLRFELDIAPDSKHLLSVMNSPELLKSKLTADEAKVASELLAKKHYHLVRTFGQSELKNQTIFLGDLKMPFATKITGEAPPSGRSLYISLHGGGNCPARVNDSQWANQLMIYNVEEGVYIAPRAPTDEWNQWHQEHIDDCFTRLIEHFIAFENIDPDRVFLIGYSSGGDGVYQLAPRMADQFAAAGMMAGHPNDSTPAGLRNLPFTLHVGALDDAYNRNTVATEWSKKLADLREEDSNGYVHWAKLHEGKGHWMDGHEAKGLEWMGQFSRHRFPDKVVWVQGRKLRGRFYWVGVPNFERSCRMGDKIVARREGNTFVLEEVPAELPSLSILLSDEMNGVDFDSDIRVCSKEVELFNGPVERSVQTMLDTLLDRGDFRSMYSAKLTVSLKPTKKGHEYVSTYPSVAVGAAMSGCGEE